jgi:hypothetical protein
MPTTSTPFSTAFDRLCNFVAIRQTDKAGEVLRQLLLRCPLLLPEQRWDGPATFVEALHGLFGLQLPPEQIQRALDQLRSAGHIKTAASGSFLLDEAVRERLTDEIREARRLEDAVRDGWFASAAFLEDKCDRDEAWKALQAYLAGAFERHGVQSVALLDVTVATDGRYEDSLRSILSRAIAEHCEEADRQQAAAAITDFLATVGTDGDRTRYVVQLADGAFSYYSLTVPDDVAEQLRSKLASLTLFLDTNFLFGILDLHFNPLVDVSEELLRLVKENGIPFLLRYHEATEREMRRTLAAIGADLKGRHWSPQLSAAAARSRKVSGIQRKYHERNARTRLDPEDFLRPYDHLDVILREKGIDIYRAGTQRPETKADLLADYEAFLNAHNKQKPYESMDHDMSVLHTVRTLRSRARSSLEAKALCVTCDYLFARFDWEQTRGTDRLSCTVLPNQLLQLLRPFVPASQDFNRSFANSFAIPEFRTTHSGATVACSKMLSILSGYEGLKEETAASMLANDVLINQLRHTNSETETRERIESFLTNANAELIEETTALRTELTRRAAAERNAVLEADAERKKLDSARQALSAADQQIVKTRDQALADVKAAQLEAEAARRRAIEAEEERGRISKTAEELKEQVTAANRQKLRLRLALGFALGIAVGIGCELLIRYFNVLWLLDHSNSYSLRASWFCAEVAFFVGLIRRDWRGTAWGIVGLAFAIVVVSVLGGPRAK